MPITFASRASRRPRGVSRARAARCGCSGRPVGRTVGRARGEGSLDREVLAVGEGWRRPGARAPRRTRVRDTAVTGVTGVTSGAIVTPSWYYTHVIQRGRVDPGDPTVGRADHGVAGAVSWAQGTPGGPGRWQRQVSSAWLCIVQAPVRLADLVPPPGLRTRSRNAAQVTSAGRSASASPRRLSTKATTGSTDGTTTARRQVRTVTSPPGRRQQVAVVGREAPVVLARGRSRAGQVRHRAGPQLADLAPCRQPPFVLASSTPPGRTTRRSSRAAAAMSGTW